MLGKVKRPYRQILNLRGYGWLQDNPLIEAYDKTIVYVTDHNGPFRNIRTFDGLHFYGIGKGLLEPIRGRHADNN